MKTIQLAILALFVTACGCGGKEEAPTNTPTIQAPAPVAPPPVAARPTPAAAPVVANTPAPVSKDPNAMVVVEPTKYRVIGMKGVDTDGEKMVAVVPARKVDSFTVQPNSNLVTRPSNPSSKKLPPGFTPQMTFGVHESGYPMRILCEKDKSEMVLVPAGVFQMGSDDGPSETRPAHPMYVDAFYMDVNETTLEDYLAFREDQKTRKQRLPEAPLNAEENPQMPVLGVNYSDAKSYAKWAGKDLPTEAEWEKAARGTQANLYPWGQGRPAWTGEREKEGIQPVGSETTDKSIYGINDLAGNAREWCIDFFAIDAYPELASDTKDIPRDWNGPRNPTEKFERTVKGNGPDWKLYHRDGVVMTENAPDIGFRCVLRFVELN